MKKIDRKLIQIVLICLIAAAALILVWQAGSVITAIRLFIGAVSPILVGACIAFILNIPLSFTERKLPQKFLKRLGRGARIFCLSITLLAVSIIISVFVLLIFPELKETIITVVNDIPDYAASLVSTLAEITGKTEAELMEMMNINWESVSSAIAGFIESSGDKLISSTIGVTGNVITALFRFVVSLIFAVWLLIYKEKATNIIRNLLKSFCSEKLSQKISSLLKLSSDIFSAFISGQLTEAFILGGLCFIGMLIFGFPYALTTSVIIIVTAFVPIFGAIIGAAVGALLCLTESFALAIWFLVYIIVLQQFETNVIYPKVMGKSVGLPGIWVLIAVTIGGNLFGALGLICAVPVCAVLYTLFNVEIEKRLAKKQAPKAKES